MNTLRVFPLLLLCSLSAARANLTAPLTITWGAQESGGALADSKGTALPPGTHVRLGLFDLEPRKIAALMAHPGLLETHFTILADAAIGDFGAVTHYQAPQLSIPGNSEATPGAFAANLVLLPDSAANWNNTRLYLWASHADGAEIGIFSDVTWNLTNAGFENLVFDLSQVSANDPEDVFLGRNGPETSSLLGGLYHKLVTVSSLLADEADNDHDGASGLLETAFGMDPSSPDQHRLPQIVPALQNGQSVAALSFSRKSGGATDATGSYIADGLRYTVESSPDLSTWTAVGNHAAIQQLSSHPDGTERVTLTIDPTAFETPCHYLRVRIDRLP